MARTAQGSSLGKDTDAEVGSASVTGLNSRNQDLMERGGGISLCEKAYSFWRELETDGIVSRAGRSLMCRLTAFCLDLDRWPKTIHIRRA